MKSLSSLLSVLFFLSILSAADLEAQTGNTSIAKWKDDKKGAYSLRFDDSMWSHHDHAIPNLVKRGVVGSFYLNPATWTNFYIHDPKRE